MSNSPSVSETELDSNSDHTTEHTNTTTGSATQPEYEHTPTASRANISKDSVAQSEYEHTYVHSLKTLAYLAWVGWPKPKDKETNPIQDITKDCECGCIINGVHIAKPHFRVRN